MNDETQIWFGKHSGIPLGDVPAQYLLWLGDQRNLDSGLREYIERNRRCLEQEVTDSVQD